MSKFCFKFYRVVDVFLISKYISSYFSEDYLLYFIFELLKSLISTKEENLKTKKEYIGHLEFYLLQENKFNFEIFNSFSENNFELVYSVLNDEYFLNSEYFGYVKSSYLNHLYNIDIFETKFFEKKLRNNKLFLSLIKKELDNEYSENFIKKVYGNFKKSKQKIKFLCNVHLINQELFKNLSSKISDLNKNNYTELIDLKVLIKSIIYIISFTDNEEIKKKRLKNLKFLFDKFLSNYEVSDFKSFANNELYNSSKNLGIEKIINPIINKYLDKKKYLKVKIDLNYWINLLNSLNDNQEKIERIIYLLNIFFEKLKNEKKELEQNYKKKTTILFEENESWNELKIKFNDIYKLKKSNNNEKELLVLLSLILRLKNNDIYKEIFDYFITKCSNKNIFTKIFRETDFYNLLSIFMEKFNKKDLLITDFIFIEYYDLYKTIKSCFQLFSYVEREKYDKPKSDKEILKETQKFELKIKEKIKSINSFLNNIQDLSQIKHVLQFLKSESRFKIIERFSKINLNDKMENILLKFDNKEIEKFFEYKPLFQNQLYKKFFYLFFFDCKEIREKDKIFESYEEGNLLRRYLNVVKDKQFYYITSIYKNDWSEIMDMEDINTQRNLDNTIKQQIDLSLLVSLLEKAFLYCLEIKSEYFDENINNKKKAKKLLKGIFLLFLIKRLPINFTTI